MRRLFWAAMGVALISMVFAGCKEEEPTYMVQVTATEGGTVEGQNGEYKEGETVEFKAIPADGYYFTKWSNGSTDNPLTITISNKDITLTAQFAQSPLVTITAGDNGTIDTEVNARYAPGSSVTVTAKPADGCVFMGWSDGSTDNPRTITISASDITLEAQFAQNALITITAGSNGTIGGSDNGRYAQGETLTFTAIPAMGYCFSQWSDGNINNPREITVGKDDISLTAEFAKPTIATVDLGLESGTLWATCNIGAANPWNYGDYYAWGETQTKDNYSWKTYKYCKGSEETLTKYCYYAEYGYNGFTDALTTLEVADDAATAAFGEGWAMPTNAEWEELYSQCYWVWTENYNNRNVSGYIVYRAKAEGDKGIKVYYDGTPSASYSLIDAHIFLPAAGFRYYSTLGRAGSDGYYWSSSLYYPYYAHDCSFDSSDVYPSPSYSSRCCGYSVRPVKRP